MIKNKKDIEKIKNANNNACTLNELNSSCVNCEDLLDKSNDENVSLDIDKSNMPSTNITKKDKINCKIHVMPPAISDADINALFAGLVSIVRRKIELETRAEIINANLDYNRLTRALKAKQAECVRLKNELLELKNKQDK